MKPLSIGVAFITHCAKHHLPLCLPPILNSPLKPKVLLVNSSSGDGTVELAQEMGVDTLLIPRRDFNHGSTREMARAALGTDIVVMMTPDAYASGDTLEKLVQPLIEGRASISYARQIPHKGADIFESFPRAFNYPAESQVRGLEDLKEHQVYTFFCSDSCAAYLNEALNEVGGFPSVLTGEDTVVTAMLLRKGHRVAYAADALVRHSHRYSLMQEFRRYFDTGLARATYQRVIETGRRDESRGWIFAKELTKTVAKEAPHLLPYACLQTAAKWCGYRLGRFSRRTPTWFKRRLSSQDFYWNSRDFLESGRG